MVFISYQSFAMYFLCSKIDNDDFLNQIVTFMLTINFQTYHTKIHTQQLLKVKKKIIKYVPTYLT